jgi:hypothetical protein
MSQHHTRRHFGWHHFYASTGRFSSTSFILTTFVSSACVPLEKPDDTQGQQLSARWEWYGRLVVETDSAVTLVRMRIDTTAGRDRHDVLLARFDFDPSEGEGDEYALTLGLDLGVARDLPLNEPIPVGPPGPPPAPGRIPAYATVTRFGTPLRPDSVRGTVVLGQRGLRRIIGRVEATLYFTAWSDTSQHATYELRQKFFGVK